MPRPDSVVTDINNPFQTAYGRIGKVPIPTTGSLPATKTILAEESGSFFILDKVDGIVLTLPAPVVGLTYDFIVRASVTSNSYKIITNVGTVFLLGQIINNDTDTGGAAIFFDANGTTIVAITMNGTTTGGLKGSHFRVTCISSTLWLIEGVNNGSGVVATPFAAS